MASKQVLDDSDLIAAISEQRASPIPAPRAAPDDSEHIEAIRGSLLPRSRRTRFGLAIGPQRLHSSGAHSPDPGLLCPQAVEIRARSPVRFQTLPPLPLMRAAVSRSEARAFFGMPPIRLDLSEGAYGSVCGSDRRARIGTDGNRGPPECPAATGAWGQPGIAGDSLGSFHTREVAGSSPAVPIKKALQVSGFCLSDVWSPFAFSEWE